MKKHLNFIVAILALLFVIVVLLKISKSHQLMTDATVARDNGQPIPVSVFPVGAGNIYSLTAFECQSKANPQITINSPLSNAPIQEVLVAIGEQVKKGQLLIRLDDRVYRTTADNLGKALRFLTETSQEQADLTDYFRQNLQRGLVKEVDYRKAKIDWLKSQSDLQNTQGQLLENQLNLEKTKLLAPNDGVVTAVAAVGQVASVKEVLASIAVIDPMLLECALSDTDYALLDNFQTAQTVNIAFPALAGRAFEGRVKKVLPLANYEQRMVNIAVELANSEGLILPGMAATGQISNNLQAMRIPAVSLLSTRDHASTVFVIEKGEVAKLRRIKTGIISGGYVEVLDGLATNDRVVVAGQVDLQEGDLVRIVDPSREDQ